MFNFKEEHANLNAEQFRKIIENHEGTIHTSHPEWINIQVMKEDVLKNISSDYLYHVGVESDNALWWWNEI